MAHDVTLNRENFRARKMAEMENEVARLTAENEELKALLAARDAEIERLKRNLKLASEMMKEVESECL